MIRLKAYAGDKSGSSSNSCLEQVEIIVGNTPEFLFFPYVSVAYSLVWLVKSYDCVRKGETVTSSYEMSMLFVSSCFWLHHKLLSVLQLMHGEFLDNL